jgi:hypothetical protein
MMKNEVDEQRMRVSMYKRINCEIQIGNRKPPRRDASTQATCGRRSVAEARAWIMQKCMHSCSGQVRATASRAPKKLEHEKCHPEPNPNA